MKLELFNDLQMKIADILWNTESLEDVEKVVETYGVDAIIVREMMMASILDEENDVELSADFLKKFQKNS